MSRNTIHTMSIVANAKDDLDHSQAQDHCANTVTSPEKVAVSVSMSTPPATPKASNWFSFYDFPSLRSLFAPSFDGEPSTGARSLSLSDMMADRLGKSENETEKIDKVDKIEKTAKKIERTKEGEKTTIEGIDKNITKFIAPLVSTITPSSATTTTTPATTATTDTNTNTSTNINSKLRFTPITPSVPISPATSSRIQQQLNKPITSVETVQDTTISTTTPTTTTTTTTTSTKPKKQIMHIDIHEIDQVAFNTSSATLTIFTRLFAYPTIVVKTHVQTALLSGNRSPTSMEVTRHILQTEGVPGLLRGFAPSLLNTLIRQPYFVLYEYLRFEIARLHTVAGEPVPKNIFQVTKDGIAAGIGSVIYQSFCNPIDVVVQRLMVQRRMGISPVAVGLKPTGSAGGLGIPAVAAGAEAAAAELTTEATAKAAESTAKAAAATSTSSSSSTTTTKPRNIMNHLPSLQLARDIYKNEGFAAFYRGYLSSSILFGINSCLWYGSFSYFMQVLVPFFDERKKAKKEKEEKKKEKMEREEALEREKNGQFDIKKQGYNNDDMKSKSSKVGDTNDGLWDDYPWAAQTLSALSSGMLSVFLTNPIDVVRTRFMVNGRIGDGSTFFSLFKELWAKDGARGLMLGVAPRMLSFAPISALTMTVFQVSKAVGHEVYLKKENEKKETQQQLQQELKQQRLKNQNSLNSSASASASPSAS